MPASFGPGLGFWPAPGTPGRDAPPGIPEPGTSSAGSRGVGAIGWAFAPGGCMSSVGFAGPMIPPGTKGLAMPGNGSNGTPGRDAGSVLSEGGTPPTPRFQGSPPTTDPGVWTTGGLPAARSASTSWRCQYSSKSM